MRSCDKRAGTSPAYASRLWKGRSVSSRATGNGPAFCECFVCANKCTAKYRASCCDWLIEAARSTWTSRVDMETTTQQINTTAHMDTHTHTHTTQTHRYRQTDTHTHRYTRADMPAVAAQVVRWQSTASGCASSSLTCTPNAAWPTVRGHQPTATPPALHDTHARTSKTHPHNHAHARRAPLRVCCCRQRRIGPACLLPYEEENIPFWAEVFHEDSPFSSLLTGRLCLFHGRLRCSLPVRTITRTRNLFFDSQFINYFSNLLLFLEFFEK